MSSKHSNFFFFFFLKSMSTAARYLLPCVTPKANIHSTIVQYIGWRTHRTTHQDSELLSACLEHLVSREWCSLHGKEAGKGPSENGQSRNTSGQGKDWKHRTEPRKPPFPTEWWYSKRQLLILQPCQVAKTSSIYHCFLQHLLKTYENMTLSLLTQQQKWQASDLGTPALIKWASLKKFQRGHPTYQTILTPRLLSI